MRRVLIVTYYWPPSAGSGVQRWLKFSKYLPEFGWQPVIFTPENPDFALQDQSLLEDIPREAEVIKRPIWEPYQLLKLLPGKKDAPINAGLVSASSKSSLKENVLSWVRGNFFIPDPRLFWRRPAVRYLKSYLGEHPVDAVITTGPPHSMHLIGLDLKRKKKIPWIADFRDPWSKLDFLQNFKAGKRAQSSNASLEQKVVREATYIIGASPSMVQLIQGKPTQKYLSITNGYDETDFENFTPKREDDFILFHGGLLNRLRNPTPLWEAIATILDQPSAQDKKIKIRLAGVVDPGIVKELEEQFQDRFEFLGYLDHKAIIEQYERANLLLLLVNNTFNATVNIPGKVFEYFATHKPILAFGPASADAIQLIRETQTGQSFPYDASAQTIQVYLNQLLKQEETLVGNFDPSRYSRKNLSQTLAALLEKVSSSGRMV